MRREICQITRESFAAYGTVLEFSGPRGWEIAVREESPGWRIALLEFGAGPARRLECHPFSRESFEPVQGTGILLTARPEAPEEFQAFLLDKPVCLNKGVWHQVLTPAGKASIKITENLEVESEYWELPQPVSAAVILGE